MKKVLVWGVGFAIVAIAAYLSFIQVGYASGQGKLKGSSFNAHNSGSAQDSMSDDIPDHPGADRVTDRVPDSSTTGPDRGGTDGDGLGNGIADCGNGPGDGNCGGPFSNNGRDDLSDYNGPGDGNEDFPSHDAAKFIRINRIHDEATDKVADNKASDRYLLDHHLKPIVGSETGDGVPDNINKDSRDAVGLDSTPDRVQSNQDNTPDGIADRTNVRDRAPWNSAQASKDVVDAKFGPGDKSRDHGADRGGLSTGAGGGGGGCSLVAGQSATPASGIAYLLVLLTPAALVMIRRIVRRK